MTDHALTLYYAPQSRASTTRVILDELGADYELKVLNPVAGDLGAQAYLEINPLGKVPALRHHDSIVTESIAIALHVADLYPQAGLAPVPGDPLRAAYLRWMAFYGSTFEPAIVDRSFGYEPDPTQATYRSYDRVIEVLASQLEKAPYLLGQTLSVADLQYGSAFRWLLMFNLLPDLPVFREYAERITARPSFQRVFEDEARLVAEREAAA